MEVKTKGIDAPTAAKQAAEYLNSMLPEAEEILLEEVEQLEEKTRSYWLITLSYNLNLSGIRGLRGIGYSMGRRDYKSFKIDAISGEIVSMKIRTV